MLLVEKVAIVTGVGAGLGKAAAIALAREGAQVALVARTERSRSSGARRSRFRAAWPVPRTAPGSPRP